VTPALKFDVLCSKVFNLFPIVKSRRIAKINPEPDLHFVALHGVENKFWRKSRLQRNLVFVSKILIETIWNLVNSTASRRYIAGKCRSYLSAPYKIQGRENFSGLGEFEK